MDADKTNHLISLLTICAGTIFIGCALELFRIFFKNFKIKSKYIFLFVLIILIILKTYTNVSYPIISWGIFGSAIGTGIIDFTITTEKL